MNKLIDILFRTENRVTILINGQTRTRPIEGDGEVWVDGRHYKIKGQLLVREPLPPPTGVFTGTDPFGRESHLDD